MIMKTLRYRLVIIIATIAVITLQAQDSYLHLYKGGSVKKSYTIASIDSALFNKSGSDLYLDLYRNGMKHRATNVEEIDSFKIGGELTPSGVYMGVICFDQALYTKPIGSLSSSTKSAYSSFISNLTSSNGTLLYYAVDNALSAIREAELPEDIVNVSVVTFTDGLDQGSIMMNSDYTTNEAYLSAVEHNIKNEKVKGIPITAYSIGLRGNDVTDVTQFQENLKSLASSDANAIEVSSISEVSAKFDQIANEVYNEIFSSTVSLTIPGQSDVSRKSAVIMLVLDCSSSLGSQFNTVKTQAGNFISKLADYGNDEKFTPIDIDVLEIFPEVAFDEMVKVEGGTFTMGATSEQGSDASDDESPAHQVTLSDFYIGKYEVTQGLWEAVMSYMGECADGSSMSAYSSDVWLGSNPSSTYGVGANYPAYYVSHDDIVNIFLPRLNKITGKTFRLPTEAEWEYAARGGNKSAGYKYSGSNTLGDVAWYIGNIATQTQEVGAKQPNELGIYDMSGNVWEWCSDWYGSYSSSSQTDPTGPSTGIYRVLRGGSWINSVEHFRLSRRYFRPSSYSNSIAGFRLVLVP